jgi:hypothetical protein
MPATQPDTRCLQLLPYKAPSNQKPGCLYRQLVPAHTHVSLTRTTAACATALSHTALLQHYPTLPAPTAIICLPVQLQLLLCL